MCAARDKNKIPNEQLLMSLRTTSGVYVVLTNCVNVFF